MVLSGCAMLLATERQDVKQGINKPRVLGEWTGTISHRARLQRSPMFYMGVEPAWNFLLAGFTRAYRGWVERKSWLAWLVTARPCAIPTNIQYSRHPNHDDLQALTTGSFTHAYQGSKITGSAPFLSLHNMCLASADQARRSLQMAQP